MTDETLEHRLAAILSADVAGFSRLMAADELGTIRRIRALREEFRSQAELHGGRVVDDPGDNILAEFPTASAAVDCAVELQRRAAARNADVEPERRMAVRIGVELGEVAVSGDRLYGVGINTAARLEARAPIGGICLSESVRAHLHGRRDSVIRDLGSQRIDHLDEPIRAWAIDPPDGVRPRASRAILRPIRTSEPRIAILPFVTVGAGRDDEYYADGLTMDLQTALVKISGLSVVGEPSTFATRAEPLTLRQVSSDLGAEFLVEGSVRRDGARVRICAQLVEASSGHRLWAERYDRDDETSFEVLDEVVEEIVTALDVELVSGESARVFRKSLRKPRAREAYYRGWQALFGTSRDAIERAAHWFQRTIDEEPESPLGHALAAWAAWWAVFRGLSTSPDADLERAESLAHRALALGDCSGLAHLMLAHVHLLRRDFEGALREAEVALEERPSCDGALAAKAQVLTFVGRPSEAVPLARRAIEQTPVVPPLWPAILAHAFAMADQPEEAIAAADAILEHHPETLAAQLIRAGACATLGRAGDARSSVDAVLSLAPDFAVEAFTRRQPYRDPEDSERVRRALRAAGLP